MNEFIGKFCVIRTYSAGVHVGIVRSVEGKTVVLKDARRVWRWKGANSLNELSQSGVSTTEWTRISEPVEVLLLTEAIEVIPCTPESEANLRQSRWLS